MKKTIVLLTVISGLILILTSCINLAGVADKNEKVYLFRPDGESFSINLSLSFIKWVSGSCGSGANIIPVHNNDILYIFLKKETDEPILIRYDEKDGANGQFDYKKEDGYISYYSLKNTVVQLNLSDKSGAWKWIENADAASLRAIRMLCFTEDIDPSFYPLLKKLAEVNKSPDLFLGNASQVLDILSIFQPRFISLGDWSLSEKDESAVEAAYELVKKQKNIERIFITPGGNNIDKYYRFISSLPSLRCVMINSALFNHLTLTGLPPNLKNLEELIISGKNDYAVPDLSLLKKMTQLKKVRFIDTDIGNIDDLYSLPGLTEISFSGTEIGNLPDIRTTGRLKWFSFPANTTQEYFDAFLEKNLQVEYIEVIGCSQITDATPLTLLKNPKGIIIIDSEIKDYTVLSGLKNPEFLILPQMLFTDGKDSTADTLKTQLPETEIVCGEPFCLGSGWILLFPLSLAVCLLLIVIRRKVLARSRERHD